MKKLIWLMLVLLIFVTVACEESKAINSKDEGQDQENTKEQMEDVDEEVKAEETSEKEDTDKEKMSEPKEDKPIEAQYAINEENSLVMPLNDSINEKIVLLTIDDAPHNYSLEMAKTLNELSANAIFFVNGHFLDTTEDEEILKKIHDMGFKIGNHTYNHASLPDSSQEEQKKEIISLNDRVEEIIGERPEFFRAPFGANTDFSKEVAKDEGMVVMNWTYGYDYFKPYMDADKLKKAMITGEGPEVDVPYSLLKPGANLLMHDREWTAKALKDIVIGLREKGYEMADPSLIQTKE
ncbi:polysaccharide deacetylase family protein [Virgibacillus litoralis]|uniref:Peptidoglycan/xylan/chitin deacetylase (PgdA/CDA1 family) n=1 Tax=Virgibacillus litoralis TaxID=578221 RepID=A0ABS4HD24_9BACI|nr:polysaccharide deacetylase family protein [Virgibacillus litoralis]MBP1948753.1 peptidoglycan/xylan/chitin deacetylase (PgdA/CDA1 family) [Virgibacillus litoralis]